MISIFLILPSQYSSLASLIIARGDRNNTFHANTIKIGEKVKAAYNTVKWNPFPVDFWRGKDCLDFT
jgi:hypothetical protein